MPLCPQITNTPITVVQNSDFVVSNVLPVVVATTTQVNEALDDAAAALAEANTAYALASTSLQTSSNTIVNASNQLTAINGNGITVYAGASSTSGARVVLNSAGIAGFNGAGSSTFAIDASNGNVSMTGALFTGGTISGGELNIAGNCIITTAGLLTATGANITGTINASTGTIGGFTISSTNIYTANLDIQSTGSIIGGNSSTLFYGYANIGGGTAGTERLIVTGDSSFDGTITTTSHLTLGGELTVTGRVVFNSGTIRFPNIGGITGGTTMRFDTATGRVYYLATSSRTVKDNITDIKNVPGLDPKALLDLPIRAFTYKPGQLVDTDDRVDVMVPGFIAEELDEVYPIATDYSDGPLSWNDRFIIPGMLGLIQDLYKEIATLKGE